ncbi:MAG: thioredoxin family protein [Bdellovibrionaceae bacterium]|nr:thioredoxin family protein [Pseudobdellovibrionaceae bacterium]
MALTYTPSPDLGQTCPDFNLPATDGRIYGKKDLAPGRPFLVMFICNHCPYVKAIEDRLITLGRDLQALNVPVVAISANDANRYAEDSFDSMKARAELKSYTFPYLYDENQSVAKSFGAVCTPDYFMYDGDGKLAYRGRLDDSWKEADKVTVRELYEAAKLLAAGQPAPVNQTPSMGCSIKWKE